MSVALVNETPSAKGRGKTHCRMKMNLNLKFRHLSAPVGNNGGAPPGARSCCYAVLCITTPSLRE